MTRSQLTLPLCAVSLSILSLLPAIHSFDSGHHYDLSRNVLMYRGFNESADSIPIVQVQNYMTDWNALTYGLQYPNFDLRKEQANLLHFNNLFNSTYVAKYFTKLTMNEKSVVDAVMNGTLKQLTASQSGEFQPLDKPFLLLSLIGFVFHAVSDYWTHSNYYTTMKKPAGSASGQQNANGQQCFYPLATYNFTEGFIDWNVHTYVYPEAEADQSAAKAQGSFPGMTKPDGNLVEHGGYFAGINKDSYVRNHFDDAYTGAFLQCLDAVDTIKGWVDQYDKSIWQRVQQYIVPTQQDRTHLETGLDAALQVSMYIEQPFFTDENDGHWKGLGSGDKSSAASTSAKFIASSFQTKSIYQRAIWDTNVFDILTDGLTDPRTVSDSVLRNFNPKQFGIVNNDVSEWKAVAVRTWQAGRSEVDTPKSTNGNTEFEGLYAITSIAGQQFHDSYQFQTLVTPHWLSIHMIPVNQRYINISYDLMIYNEDNFLDLSDSAEDIQANIKPSSDPKSYSYAHSIDSSSQNVADLAPAMTRLSLQASADQAAEIAAEHQIGSVSQKLRREYLSIRAAAAAHLLPTDTQLGSKTTTHKFVSRIGETSRPNDDYFVGPLDTANKGVLFVYDTETQQIVSGLPSWFLGRSYEDVNHTLRLVPSEGADLANANLSIWTHTFCSADRQKGSLGLELEGPFIRGNAVVDGATPIESHADTAHRIAAAFMLVTLTSVLSLISHTT